MGITGLLPFLKEIVENTHIQTYAGKRVAVDTYCWIHKGGFACASDLAKGIKTDVYVNYCLKFINMLKSYKVTPVLVFDGCNVPAKEEVERVRKESRQINLLKGKQFLAQGNLSKARDCFVKCVNVTSEMALSVIKAARSKGIDCIVAPYEADAQLAYLIKNKLVDAIITEDSDLLCFGCETVLYKLDLTGRCQKIEQKNISKVSCIKGFTIDEFRQACILSGCDYLKSIKGVGLKKAVKAIKLSKGKNINLVVKRLNQYIPNIGIVDSDYPILFDKANKTFLYQLAFDPVSRKLVPINPYPGGLKIENLKFAGPEFSNELAFQIALGNVEVFRKQKIDNFDVDVWLQNSAHYLQCTSIWKKADAPILKKEVYNKDSGCAFNIYGTKVIDKKTTSIKTKVKNKSSLSASDALSMLFKSEVVFSNNSANTAELSKTNIDANISSVMAYKNDQKTFTSGNLNQIERLSPNKIQNSLCKKINKEPQNKNDMQTVRSRYFQNFCSEKPEISHKNLTEGNYGTTINYNEKSSVSSVIETNNLVANIKRKIISSSINIDEVVSKRQKLIINDKYNTSPHKKSKIPAVYTDIKKDQNNVFSFLENSTHDKGLESVITNSEDILTFPETKEYVFTDEQKLDDTDKITNNSKSSPVEIISSNKGKNPFCKKTIEKPKNEKILNLYDKSEELKLKSSNSQENNKKQVFKSKYFGPARASGLKKKRKPFQATIKRFFEKA